MRIYADRVSFSETLQMVEFFGHVILQSSQVEIHADEGTFNTATDLAVMRGIVSIRTEDGVTSWGTALEYNAHTRNWRFIDFSTQYPASYLGASFIAPVYVQGSEVSGLPYGLRANNTEVTTCNLPTPHYYIQARRVDIFPNDKIIAYDNDVYVLGHRILHIPWFFLSLRQNDRRWCRNWGKTSRKAISRGSSSNTC